MGAEERARSRPTEGCRWAWSGATGEGSVPMGAGAGVVGAAAGAKTLEALKRNDAVEALLGAIAKAVLYVEPEALDLLVALTRAERGPPGPRDG